jgi:hypothetical protein
MRHKREIGRNRKWMRELDEQKKSFSDQYPVQQNQAREEAALKTPLRRFRTEVDLALERREQALLSGDNAAFNQAIRDVRMHETKLQDALVKRKALEETIFQSLVAQEKQRAQNAAVADELAAKTLDPLVAQIETALTL